MTDRSTCVSDNVEDDEEDDDIPQLSARTLAALQEFYAEQQNLQLENVSQGHESTCMPNEDWVSSLLI